MKYSILTYNFGNYEPLREPKEIDKDCEYILVTDNKKIKSNVYKIKYLSKKFDNYTPISKTFYVRYHPFDFVTTNTVIILDGSMQINKSLNNLYTAFINSKCDIAAGCWIGVVNNIEGMFDYWLNHRGYDYNDYLKNKAFLLALNFTSCDIFHETGYLIINKNTKNLDFLVDTFESLKQVSKSNNDLNRLDQTIFNAMLYKIYSELNVFNLSRQIIQSKYITYCKHNTNQKNKVKLNNEFEKTRKLFHLI